MQIVYIFSVEEETIYQHVSSSIMVFQGGKDSFEPTKSTRKLHSEYIYFEFFCSKTLWPIGILKLAINIELELSFNFSYQRDVTKEY